jgi:hypothetical protein
MIETGMARKQKPALKRQRNPVNGIPVEDTNLTTAERRLLPDPSIVTEDDADAITVFRRRRKNPKLIPLDSLLKRYGMERRKPVER